MSMLASRYFDGEVWKVGRNLENLERGLLEVRKDADDALLMASSGWRWVVVLTRLNMGEREFLRASNFELKLRWMKDSMALRAELPLSVWDSELLFGSMISRVFSSEWEF